MVVALLYAMQSPCNCFTLSVTVAIVVVTIVGKTKTMLRWRSRCRAGDVGDHKLCFGDGDHEYQMMMAISCHIF